MFGARLSSPVALAAGLGLLLLGAAGCTRWEPVPLSPAAYAAARASGPVRVVERDGTHTVVQAPRFEGDSVRVITGECRPFGQRENRRYLCPTSSVAAIDDVRRFEVRRVDKTTTLLGVTAIGFLVAYFVTWEGNGGG